MLIIVPPTPIPDNARTTIGAIMPRVFCLIEGDKAKLFKNRSLVRSFKHDYNALKKQGALLDEEVRKALVSYSKLLGAGKLNIRKRRVIKVEREEQANE